ncbi:MAG: hypothetical protein K1X67_05915, partial [Fimbriimonadaceae bacterium]|nr:hypothetical protein [Fimbriimonadaceae bacterium]
LAYRRWFLTSTPPPLTKDDLQRLDQAGILDPPMRCPHQLQSPKDLGLKVRLNRNRNRNRNHSPKPVQGTKRRLNQQGAVPAANG